MKLSRADHELYQQQVLMLAGLIYRLPLQELLEDISISHAFAPIIDPTLYRKALFQGNLEAVEDLARLMLQVKTKVAEIVQKRGLRLPDLAEQLEEAAR